MRSTLLHPALLFLLLLCLLAGCSPVGGPLAGSAISPDLLVGRWADTEAIGEVRLWHFYPDGSVTLAYVEWEEERVIVQGRYTLEADRLVMELVHPGSSEPARYEARASLDGERLSLSGDETALFVTGLYQRHSGP